MLAMSE